jgi:ATP-dependent RNA helicase SUPV3L1/SUV3
LGDRRREDGQKRQRHGERDGARVKGGDKGGPGRGKQRFDKGGGRRDDKRRGPTVVSSSPARSKGADPDSPFAALSALKESLGKGGSGN